MLPCTPDDPATFARLALLTPKQTIAITGTGASGKTMFLTSLLWQLREWENADFRLDRNVSIRGFKPRNGRPAASDVFPFDKYQDALVSDREWPAKTKDVQRYSCEFRRSDHWRWRPNQQLDFVDVPGERAADAAVVEFDDFAEWSDHLFDYFASDSDYEAGQRFRSTLETGQQLDRDAFLHSYRLVLAEFVRDNKPLVTPSTFFLDREGKLAPCIVAGQEDWLARQRVSGLDPETQFAPLPPAVRQRQPDLLDEMRTSYRRYRDDLARPFFDHLWSSDALIVLVDIPLLLRGSVARFNDTRQTVQDLIGAMSRESTIGRRLARAVTQLSFSALQRVAFVANKADLVSRDDWQNDRLRSLLRQMNGRASELLPDVESKWFVCSACISTRAGSKPHTLAGAPWHDNPERREYEYPVSAVPETWPHDWKPGDFSFRDVHPEVGPNTLYPPKHHGLAAVFDFVAMT